MAKGLFQSPKKALLFVGVTMFGVAILVGPEGDEGALIQAAEGLDASAREFEVDPDAQAPSRRPDRQRDRQFEEIAFTPDEELVDTAEGFDPTPELDEPYEPETDLGTGEAQVVRVDVSDRAREEEF